MIEVVNRQRKIKINLKLWVGFTKHALNEVVEAAGKSLTVAFVSDKKMKELNSLYRGKKTTTDVLSFPAAEEFEDLNASAESESYLGDIAISLEQAQRQALENKLDFETEIKQLILHGILHLCGYDHETDNGEMNDRELKLRDKLKI
jgi:probable rRNA maturation factor